jgi:glycine/D-amino acid oxidase-like deaminating enzyme/nitrite reductase/ring-hydroxylating ferredoxin subunit
MESIWKIPQKQYGGELKGNIERDIVVVGGGIAGILTAYQLAERGFKVTLIEAKQLYSGVTSNTTAHIEALQGLLYSELIQYSFNAAKLFYQSQTEAIENYQKIIDRYSIDCDFERVDSYVFSFSQNDELMKEYDALMKIGAKPKHIKNLQKFNFVTDSIMIKNQAIFHPLKFLEALPKNFEIIENTRIKKIDTKFNLLFSENASIFAKKIIIATNFPIINFPGWYFLKMYKSSSYALAVKINQSLHEIYQSTLENGLIIGGLDHRTGRTNFSDKYNQLINNAKKAYPDSNAEYCWSANDCITFDKIPFIGRYSQNNNDFYVITGFNKWGMTNAMAGSMLLADLIDNKKNKYEALFSPTRKKHGVSSFIVNSAETVKNLIIKPIVPVFKTEKSLKNGNGDIVYYNGKKRAVYKDENGILHAINPLCAHLKCQLTFNSNDKTWDCPCHGSRYDIEGNIITAPTVQNQL